MATYRISSTNNLTVKSWAAEVHQDIRYDTFFQKHGLMGSGPNFAVQVKEDLGKGMGDTIYYGLLETHEDDSGRMNDQQLEGYEAEFTDQNDSVTLNKYRHAIKFEVDMNEIRVKWDLPEEARAQLSRWGTVKMEKMIFTALQESFTNAVYTGTATSVDTLAAKLTPDFIRKLGAIARTGNKGARTPLRPIRMDGDEYLVMLIGPGMAYDLKTNDDWQSFQINANIRGWDNPVFRDAVGMLDNIIIKEHRLMDEADNTSDAHYGKFAILGAQALCWAWGKRPKMVVELIDYEDQMGIAYRFIAGVNRSEFSSSLGEYGVLGGYALATDLFS